MPIDLVNDIKGGRDRGDDHQLNLFHVGASVLYLKTVDSSELYRLAPRVGERSPLHATAAAKVLLAHLRPGQCAGIPKDLSLERFTDHTLVTPGALATALQQARDGGFAVCDREEFPQIVGIAAPVFGQQGDAVAALSLWNLVERQSLNDLLACAQDLLSATGKLSVRIGFEVSN